MPERVPRQDAKILRHDLHCNIVRTSHYPQSHNFLGCCDEVGLPVLEEIPGWQHIGDNTWQDVAVDNVNSMIRPGLEPALCHPVGSSHNESLDNHDFYTRTNAHAHAHALDVSRQTAAFAKFRSRSSSKTCSP